MKQSILMMYLLIINLYAFFIYGLDKSKAKSGKWRISEKHLLLSAFLGGSLGAFLGMKFFHHKTKHTIFKLGVPLMLLLHLLVLGYLFSQGYLAP